MEIETLELHKLLDSSPESNELPNVYDINESNSKTRSKKFLVVKANEADDSNSPLIPEWDFTNDYLSEENRTQHPLDATLASLEDDDVFSDEILKEFKKYRELEGQDTITSLSNNVYQRQLAKIRRKASIRSSETANSYDPLDRKKNSDPENSISSQITSLKSIFKSQESLFSRRSVKLFDSISTYVQDGSKSSVKHASNYSPNPTAELSVSNQNLNRQKRTTPEPSEKIKDSSTTNISKSDQVFEVFQNCITNTEQIDQDMLDKFVSTYKILQIKYQNKKDTNRRICLFAELLVFVVIIMLTIWFGKTVITQIQVIQMYSEASMQKFLPNLDLNNSNASMNYSTISLKK
ncbi:hypothetical protein BpHYR1_024223 [Brachionus plicatilis]|uniref:Uncharacterized protein n=1 Tax=Brachionus plicatilis TaxID=10195 RepID=A0A3M7PDA2_BRAPC|nr:hypothetical protein BpHYR1_024223 [Brachionus plicatilis]